MLLGSGAAGIGIARLVQAIIRVEGATEDEIRHAVTMLDSQGLLFEGRDGVQDDKRPFALTSDELKSLGLEPSDRYALETVIRHVAPTILIGTSGKPGVFSETAIREMAARDTEPDSAASFQPDRKLRGHSIRRSRLERRQGGRGDRQPGLRPVEALGGRITSLDRRTMSSCSLASASARWQARPGRSRTECSSWLPPRWRTWSRRNGWSRVRYIRGSTDLRSISRAIAIAVAREGRDGGVAPQTTDADLEAAVDAFIWAPEYERLEPAPEKPATID